MAALTDVYPIDRAHVLLVGWLAETRGPWLASIEGMPR